MAHWRNQAQHFIPGINSTVRVFETADIESSSDHPVDGWNLGKA